MKISNVPLHELRDIAIQLGIEFRGDDVSNRAGLRASGVLRPLQGDNPYQRVSSSPFSRTERATGDRLTGERRRVAAICWHGHRDFMRVVFSRYPDARIQTGWADYRGRDNFEDTHRETAWRNIGSIMYPMQACEACSCPVSGDDRLIAARGPFGNVTTEYGHASGHVMINAEHGQLYAWAHRPGFAWPCSGLADLDGPLSVTFDSNGLLDLEGDGGPDSDLAGDELSAWASDVLRDILPRTHPAYAVAVAQFDTVTS